MSHLQRKCSRLLPGIQTVESLPVIVNPRLVQRLYENPISLLMCGPTVTSLKIKSRALIFAECPVFEFLKNLTHSSTCLCVLVQL